ncbi:lecithin retinol acyltransferase family protein [Geminocystis sp. CENA526]|uniref:lecithin retinol acyltransferase family protein n=1 Tax=Geminocystis sp. CENA526 TaxID=1355871 RepID=UPI003D6ECF32
MAKGDHLYYSFVFDGFPITHHGIDCGDGWVIEFAERQGRNIVTQTPLKDFYSKGKVYVKSYEKCDHPNIVVGRAAEMFGQTNYNLFTNNCEHLATYCKTGTKFSIQISIIPNPVINILRFCFS